MATCPGCGAANPDYVPYCGRCGQAIDEKLRENDNKSKFTGPPPSKASSVTVRCSWCGRMTEADKPCNYCGKDPTSGESRRKTTTSEVGGACALVAGALAIVQGLFFIAGEALFISTTGNMTGALLAIGIAEVVLGGFSVRAGMYARKQENYYFALVGSILGMVAFGFVIGVLLGLVAVILVALSQQEFQS